MMVNQTMKSHGLFVSKRPTKFGTPHIVITIKKRAVHLGRMGLLSVLAVIFILVGLVRSPQCQVVSEQLHDQSRILV
jgi:hypothetical protein